MFLRNKFEMLWISTNNFFSTAYMKVRSYYAAIADILITSLPQVTAVSPHFSLNEVNFHATPQCSNIKWMSSAATQRNCSVVWTNLKLCVQKIFAIGPTSTANIAVYELTSVSPLLKALFCLLQVGLVEIHVFLLIPVCGKIFSFCFMPNLKHITTYFLN